MAEATATTQVKVTHRLEVGENAFWIITWSLATLAIGLILGLCLHYNSKSDQMIASSADPLATACALGTRSTVSNQCTAYLARGK